LDGKIWALKANSLTSPLIVTVTVTETNSETAIFEAE